MRVCLYVPCGHLLGKGWPLRSRLWCLTVSSSLSHWYPGSGVVLDCIESWSLHPYLFCWSLGFREHFFEFFLMSFSEFMTPKARKFCTNCWTCITYIIKIHICQLFLLSCDLATFALFNFVNGLILYWYLARDISQCAQFLLKSFVHDVDWLQSLKQFFINVSYHILIASLTLMALF